MRYISMDQAKPGMIVGKSVFNEEGKILVNYKVCLTEKLIGQMKEKKLQGLYISDELSKDINIEPLVSEELEQRATQVLHDMDIDAALEVASDITEELSRHRRYQCESRKSADQFGLYIQTFIECGDFVCFDRDWHGNASECAEGTGYSGTAS